MSIQMLLGQFIAVNIWEIIVKRRQKTKQMKKLNCIQEKKK